MKKLYINPCIISIAFNNSDCFLMNSSTKSLNSYEIMVSDYNDAERLSSRKANGFVAKAVSALSRMDEETDKTIFLKSYIDNAMSIELRYLQSEYRYEQNAIVQKTDSLFRRVAIGLIRKKSSYISYISISKEFSCDTQSAQKVILQLVSANIIKQNGSFYDLQIKSLHELDRIFMRLGFRSILTDTEKDEFNTYLNGRTDELNCKEIKNPKHLSMSKEIVDCYVELVDKYASAATCTKVAEIVSETRNTETKSSAGVIVSLRDVSLPSPRNFNLVWPCVEENIKTICIPISDVSLYFYPQYLIVVQNDVEFDIVKYSNVNISFADTRFLEEEEVEDAKFIDTTYKYVNKNGEKDMRYSDNPIRYRYLYGSLTIDAIYNNQRITRTLQFSNVDKARSLYNALEKLVRNYKEDKIDIEKNDGSFTSLNNDGKNIMQISEEQFDIIKTEGFKLADFLRGISKNKMICEYIDKNSDSILNGVAGSVSNKFRYLVIMDIYYCYKGLGHDVKSLTNRESIALFIALTRYLCPDVLLSYENIYPRMQEARDEYQKMMDGAEKACKFRELPSNEFAIQKILDNVDRNTQIKYTTLLYRFASAVASADGEISKEEEQWLANIMKSKEEIRDKQEVQIVESENTNNHAEMLNELIGLESVKDEITKLTNFIKIQQMRKEKGLKVSDISYHCVFTGNPGTGKTTVARIMAGIYKELGILKKGHLVETDRSGLVAEYIGQTAIKTNNIIDSALDGVLFIDEAYSLTQGAKEDYGTEAITTLLKRMEDNRDRLVVILAGYSDQMQGFIDSNPGLQSRFNRYIEFKDYNADELMEIFLLSLKNSDYTISTDAEQRMKEYITDAIANKDENFGNARFIRNVFEKVLENQAMRLSSVRNITAEMLVEITIDDVILK